VGNTIVDSAWSLLAGLLKNDPALHGILFLAVGAGDPAWDGTHTPANPAATQMQNEIVRQPVTAENIQYLNDNDEPVPQPTTRIEITASFVWPDQSQTLREFGLFGGDATDTPDSGYLVNYVIHPRLHLETGATLTRRLRLNIRPQVSPAWLELPQHWLSTSPVTHIDGVGEAYQVTLSSAGIETIGQLAAAEPTSLERSIPLMKRVEFWSKARMVVRAVTALSSVPELFDRRVWDVLATPTAELVADTGLPEEVIARLREQISTLQVALDSQYLRRLTIGELVQPL
jgi:hypothetical protein